MNALHNQERRLQQILQLLLEGEGLLGCSELPVIPSRRELSTSSIWFVREGLVRRYGASCGRPVLFDLHGSGSVVCSVLLMNRVENLFADPGARLVELPLAELGRIGRRAPEALVTLVAGLARHQHTLRNRLRLRSAVRGPALLEGLLRLLTEEIGVPCQHGRQGWIDLPSLTHQDLADLLNSTRPHVTALMNKLVGDGRVVQAKGRGLCLDPRERRNLATPPEETARSTVNRRM